MVQKAIELKNIALTYNKNWRFSLESIDIVPSSIVAFSGANGSGKSTLLRSIAVLFKPASGQIKIFGKTAFMNRKTDRVIRESITMVHQDPYLFKGTVKNNIMLGLKASDRIKNYSQAKNLLKLLEEEDIENEKIDQLSGGQRQKVALIRALIMPVKIFIFDEPFDSLDEASRAVFSDICKKTVQSGKTVLISSHKTEEVIKIADKIYNLSNGNLFQGSPENNFRGKPVEQDGSVYFDTGRVIFATLNKPGATTALIDPNAISLSLTRQHSSMRNCLKGEIRKIIQEKDFVSVIVEAGETFSAIITDKSAQQLMLKPGDKIYLGFKASSVKLF
ncbi:MAG: ATP-binding cassette domain-containing protein [Epsilonproteobacteria bacterium]|nr:ATP-binding cassette domain-containing protein [Campylobacterota bacterium]